MNGIVPLLLIAVVCTPEDQRATERTELAGGEYSTLPSALATAAATSSLVR